MSLWISATLAAALFQTLRFMLQKVLASGVLTATGSTFARFAYAAPFAALACGLYLALTGAPLPALAPGYWLWVVAGGLGQILATVLVVALFSSRNFATGITLKKTEVLQTALLGVLVMGEVIPPLGWLALGIGLIGVLLLSRTPAGAAGTGLRAVALGIGSGFFFAVAGIGYRAASLAVLTDDPLLRASVTLVCVTAAQALGMALWLAWRAPDQLRAVWQARRMGLWLGLASMAGSLGWFTAFTLQTAAYVYAVGQVELGFSLLASILVFREKVVLREVAGIAVLALSIVLLVLGG